MKDLIDPVFPDLDDPVRDLTGQRTQPSDQGSRDRLAVTLLVAVGLVALLGGIALLTGVDGRMGRGVAARVRGGESLEASGEDRWARLWPGDEVREGTRVRTGGSEARLRLRGGEVWLGPQAAARIFSDHVDVIRGEALLFSRGDLLARWADVEVSGKGMFRVTPGVNPRIGVYTGNAEVRRPGERRALAALEQLGVATRRLPAAPDPLAYRAEDPWDIEFLSRAIAFDGEVSRIARGIDVRFSTTPKPPEFYRGFRAVDETGVASLKAGAREVLGDGRFGPPSDVLITLFVAEAAGGPAVRGTMPRIAQWRAQGSRWGLIALRLGITASDFTQVVDLSQIDQVAGPVVSDPPPAPPTLLFPTPRSAGLDGPGAVDDPFASPPPPQPSSPTADAGQALPLLSPAPPPQPAPGPESSPDSVERIGTPLDIDRSEAGGVIDRLLDLLGGAG
ncbi:MAG: hypothetical protein ACRD0K_16890 [Egibacteraceae bacterium]